MRELHFSPAVIPHGFVSAARHEEIYYTLFKKIVAPNFLTYNRKLMEKTKHSLRLKHLGITTYKEAVIYIRSESYIVRAEGFEAQSRIHVSLGTKSIIATLSGKNDPK